MSTELVEKSGQEIKLSRTHAEVLARVGIKGEDITGAMPTRGGETRYTLPFLQIREPDRRTGLRPAETIAGKRFSVERRCAIHEAGKAVQVWVTDIVTEGGEGRQKSWAVSMALFYRREGLLGKKLSLDKMRIYDQLEELGVGWDQDPDVMIEVDAKTGMVTNLRLDRDAARLTGLLLTKGDEKRFPEPYFRQTERKDKLAGNFYYVPSSRTDGAMKSILSCLSTNYGLPVGYSGRIDNPEEAVKGFVKSTKPFGYRKTFVRKEDKTIETIGLFPKF